jgi:hypothetical protein
MRWLAAVNPDFFASAKVITILLVKESGGTLPKRIRGELQPGGRYLSGGVSCPQNHNDIRFLRGEPF